MPSTNRSRKGVFFTRRETALFVMFGFCAADSCGRQSKVFLPDRVNKNTSIGGGLINKCWGVGRRFRLVFRPRAVARGRQRFRVGVEKNM